MRNLFPAYNANIQYIATVLNLKSFVCAGECSTFRITEEYTCSKPL